MSKIRGHSWIPDAILYDLTWNAWLSSFASRFFFAMSRNMKIKRLKPVDGRWLGNKKCNKCVVDVDWGTE